MGKIVPSKKRVVGLFGHHGCGKTTMMDAVLKDYSKADRIGQRYLDKDEVEKEKGATFSNHIVSIDYDELRVTFFDTPGSAEFLGDIETALHSVDNVLIVINGVSGVEVTTERVWKVARRMHKPIMFFINQLDKEGADFERVASELKKIFEDGVKVVPFQVPIGKENNFRGIVNLLNKKSYIYKDDKSGEDEEQESIPEEAKEYFEIYHPELIEDIVENDEEALEKYFESGEEELNMQTLIKDLHDAYEHDQIVPVLVGSAEKNIGMDRLLFAIKNFGKLTSEKVYETVEGEKIEADFEAPLSGLIVKNDVDPFVGKLTYIRITSGTLKTGDSFNIIDEETTERVSHIYLPRFDKDEEISEAKAGDIVVIPKLKSSKIGETIGSSEFKGKIKMPEYPEPMISKSIIPNSKKDIDKITNALSKLQESDPTFAWEYDSETGETVVNGIGTIHLEVMMEKLKKNFGIDFEIGKPKIAYRETIKKSTKSEFKHKKQTGGHGQYGHVKIEITPLERGSGYVFEDKIVGGVIPKNFIPSVDKGIREALKKGVVAGYPVVDVKVTLYDGSTHDVDSSDIAFQIAARTAFKNGMKEAKPTLLEPIMHVEIIVPNEYTGGVMGEISSKRGRPMGMETISKGVDKINAEIPLAEMLDFSPKLSSISSGRGYFIMKFSHYMEVPNDIQKKIIEENESEVNA